SSSEHDIDLLTKGGIVSVDEAVTTATLSLSTSPSTPEDNKCSTASSMSTTSTATNIGSKNENHTANSINLAEGNYTRNTAAVLQHFNKVEVISGLNLIQQACDQVQENEARSAEGIRVNVPRRTAASPRPAHAQMQLPLAGAHLRFNGNVGETDVSDVSESENASIYFRRGCKDPPPPLLALPGIRRSGARDESKFGPFEGEQENHDTSPTTQVTSWSSCSTTAGGQKDVYKNSATSSTTITSFSNVVVQTSHKPPGPGLMLDVPSESPPRLPLRQISLKPDMELLKQIECVKPHENNSSASYVLTSSTISSSVLPKVEPNQICGSGIEEAPPDVVKEMQQEQKVEPRLNVNMNDQHQLVVQNDLYKQLRSASTSSMPLPGAPGAGQTVGCQRNKNVHLQVLDGASCSLDQQLALRQEILDPEHPQEGEAEVRIDVGDFLRFLNREDCSSVRRELEKEWLAEVGSLRALSY
ncbi:unnamed protein product, partial [Amoebophrya sp. A25]